MNRRSGQRSRIRASALQGDQSSLRKRNTAAAFRPERPSRRCSIANFTRLIGQRTPQFRHIHSCPASAESLAQHAPGDREQSVEVERLPVRIEFCRDALALMRPGLTENSDPHVMVVQSSENWQRCDIADSLRSPEVRRLFVQGKMRSNFVVVGRIRLEDPAQVGPH
jgi:hypothetical protein